MRNLFILIYIVFFPFLLLAQPFWRQVAEPTHLSFRNEEKPKQFFSYQLDFEGIRQQLEGAPLAAVGLEQAIPLELPLPDGTSAVYAVVNAPVMMPGLAAKYPEIRSYKGIDQSGNGENIWISLTPDGLHIIYNSQKGRGYLVPYARENNQFALAYYKKDTRFSEEGFICGVDHQLIKGRPTRGGERRGGTATVNIREYKLAVACTGEWAQLNGGTVGSALSAINVAVNLVNSIYEQELAVRFVLVDDNEKVIFTNPNTDPYFNPENGSGLLGQNQVVLNDSIGVNNYDAGHIFTRACSNNLGGIAGGPVCDNNTKGRGVTCQSTDLIEIVESVTTHELGHQFSAGHSWNNCPPTLENNPEQYAAGSAFEPGSGSTIMSYAGLCQDQNIAFDNDLYFHVGSLNEIYFFIENGTGSICPDLIPTENMFPELNLPYSNGFSIPISTPFELRAEGSDPNGDPITYCWEEYDLGPIANIGQQNVGTSPLFRSFPPTSSPVRIFPQLSNLLTNNADQSETLPTYSRDLKFRCTVRDNNLMIGGVVWEQLNFKATDQAGPFLVSYPNSVADNVEVGQFVEIRWDVANTDKGPVNCQNVNLLLSIDGGFSYPITLLANTPNDGSEFVNIPDQTTGTARVKIAAADNIFFDISDENFIIAPPNEPGYALEISPRDQQACLPEEITIDLMTSSLLDYDGAVEFEVLSGLPGGAVATFSQNPINASQQTTLTIDLEAVTEEAAYEVTIRAIAPDVDTLFRTVRFNTVSNDYSGFAIQGPLDGSSGVSSLPSFSWTNIVAADEYEIQVATSPIFADSIVYFATGIVDTSHQPSIVLQENTLYFWRVRPSNPCGSGDFTPVAAFHTESLSCATFVADNVPLNISASGMPVVSSVLPITLDAVVNDVNIPNLKGSHDLIKHLDVKLISPQGTEVLLFTDLCGNTTLLHTGLDDEAPTELPCPPNDQLPHQPQNPLSVFDGENALGDWTLQMAVNNSAGEGGALEEWSLELCSNISLSSPFLVINDTLKLNPQTQRRITDLFLLVEDDNNTAAELKYTLVSLPQKGNLLLDDALIGVGARFTQSQLNNSLLNYVHTGEDKEVDWFDFTVEDGEGGWLGILRFTIAIDAEFMVSTREVLEDQLIGLFPNPADDQIHLRISDQLPGDLDLALFNVQGQLLQQHRYEATPLITLNTSHLPQGVYLLRFRTTAGVLTKRFLLQR